jgi:hypothetical protein
VTDCSSASLISVTVSFGLGLSATIQLLLIAPWCAVTVFRMPKLSLGLAQRRCCGIKSPPPPSSGLGSGCVPLVRPTAINVAKQANLAQMKVI